MIDTVVYRTFLALHPSGSWPRGWRRWDLSHGASLGSFDFTIKNDLLGIRCLGRENMIQTVEVELPKLLYGHNGRMLRVQADVDSALQRLKLALSFICYPFGRNGGYYPCDSLNDVHASYTRVDLVWQFNLEPGFFFLALRNAKHPDIHKRTGAWEGETLAFPGTKLRISAYDKKAKMRAACPHHAMRVEVQCHDGKISEYFDLGIAPLRHLSIDAAYAAYRRALLRFGFDLVPNVNGKGTIADFLAFIAAKFPEDDPVGIYCTIRKLCPRKSRDLRKNVGNRVPSVVAFSWRDLLPANALPPLVEVPCPTKEQRVQEYFAELQTLQPQPVPHN